MKAYKGMDKNMRCRGFQFEIGKTYEEPEAKLCEKGFHACTSPLDVFAYYAPADSRYFEVDVDGVSDKRDAGDSKVAAKSITVGAEIGVAELVKAHVEFIKSTTEKEKKTKSYCAASTSTGDKAASTSTGNCAASTSTGDRAASTSTGYCAASTSTGYCAASSVGAGGSVAVAIGRDSKAKAGIGSAICLVERGEYNGKFWPIKSIRAAMIDGVTLKADTLYTLKNGEFVEVDNEQD